MIPGADECAVILQNGKVEFVDGGLIKSCFITLPR